VIAALLPGIHERRTHYRRRRILIEGGSLLLGALLLIWSLIPVYNMFLVALDPSGHNEFTYEIWPSHPTLDALGGLWSAEDDDVRDIWPAFGNSIYIGVAVMALTVLIASLASFAIGRMRLVRDWTLSSTALLTYVIPSSTLIIPFLRVMHIYRLVVSFQ
jgi:multiple sugar transport system permease protein